MGLQSALSTALTGMTEVVFAGPAGEPAREPAPTYRRDTLLAGARLPGPAIVLEMDSTLVIGPAWEGEVLADGTVQLIRKERA